MNDSQKKTVAILFGGKSSEHEVSLQSAASVLRNIDTQKYNIVPIGIDKTGVWHWQPQLKASDQKALPVEQKGLAVSFTPAAGRAELTTPDQALDKIDVVLPIMHGSFYEDGCLQGMLELGNIAYVGSGVLGSSVSMDKDVAKKLVASAGINVVPSRTVRQRYFEAEKDEIKKFVADELGYPVFVKPCNAGSSIGVQKVKEETGMEAAIRSALQYDDKALVERAIVGREIEVSVLESKSATERPLASVPGEIRATQEFYSYDAKYLDENGAEFFIPAQLTNEETTAVRQMASEIFTILECNGLARVDFFYSDGQFFFNEINTLPGFTQISMYPKMWEASGLPYHELIDHLIEVALTRHDQRNKRITSIEPDKLEKN